MLLCGVGGVWRGGVAGVGVLGVCGVCLWRCGLRVVLSGLSVVFVSYVFVGCWCCLDCCCVGCLVCCGCLGSVVVCGCLVWCVMNTC